MKVCLVIPVHNEEIVLADNIGLLSVWMRQHHTDLDWQIVIADNGSTDRTSQIGRELAVRDPRVVYWRSDAPGRGRALKNVWSGSAAEVLVYMDADLSVGLPAVGDLIQALATGADLAVGSRFAPGARVERSLLREITSRTYVALAKAALRMKTNDSQCGFKAIRAESFRRLAPHLGHPGWFFDTELVVLAERAGLNIKEIPVDWVEHRDRRRKSSVKLAGTVAGYLYDLWEYRSRLPAITSEIRSRERSPDRAEPDS